MVALVTPIATWLSSLVTTAATVLHSERVGAELGEAEYPPANADRTFDLRYTGSMLQPFAGACRRLHVSFDLRVCYRYDLDLALAGTSASGGTSRTSIARLRAADDAAVIREACLNPALYGSAGGAVVIQIIPSDHTIDDPGDGVLVATLPVVLVASYSASAVTVGAAMT